jgi:hypothetical protein
VLPNCRSLACHAVTHCRKRLASLAGESGKTATQQRRNFSEAGLKRRGAFAKREASASNVRMNSGRAKRTRREIEAVQRTITGRTNKLNRLLCAALSNTNLRRSLGENAEIIFPRVIKLPLMVLNVSCGAMQRLQTGRAEGCKRSKDNSAYHFSDCPVNIDSVAHIHSIRFNLLGRKSLYPADARRCCRCC